MTQPHEKEANGLTIDEWVTIVTTSTILLVFAAFCLCYWCNVGQKVSSERLRQEFAQEHGLDAKHLKKGRLYRALPRHLQSIAKTEIA